MGQLDAERAFYAAFSALGYTYVSYPNGEVLNTAASPIPPDTLWHALDVMYADSLAAGAGDSYTWHRGIYQATVRGPVTDSFGNPFGTYAIGARAEAIATAFKIGTSLPYPVAAPTVWAQCEEPTIIHRGKVEPDWYTVVVRIPFHMMGR